MLTSVTHNYRPTWAEIDLRAIEHNLSEIKKFVKKDVEIMPVVKANAYGHGIVEVSSALADKGISYFGVATVDEALKLRMGGIKTPILVLGSVLEEEAHVAVMSDITLTLCNYELLEAIRKISAKENIKPKVHVKVDTGMGRIGVWHDEAPAFIKEAKEAGCAEIEGVYTHFASAARDAMYTELQMFCFEDVIKKIKEEGIEPRYKHAANSIAMVDRKETHLNLVRPGILLYGIYPKESFRRKLKLVPAMALKTKIVHLKRTPAGRAISYGRTYITQAETSIATVPIGYADGYGRILSNKAEALLKGKSVKVAGIVTMDQTLFDVGQVGDVKVGDEIVLIGEQKGSSISAEKIAKLARTIPYEILAGITDRVPRVYKN